MYDLIVLGGGPGGSRVADLCGEAGMRVALVEKPPVGGTCALSGCNPKKVLAEAAQFHIQGNGQAAMLAGPSREFPLLDWPALHEYQQEFTDPVAGQKKTAFERSGVDLIEGAARFTGPRSLTANDERISFDQALIAVGARPTPLSVEGESLLTTSDEFLNAEDLPESIAFVGGGYIAMEFTHAAISAGRRVTVCESGDRCLARFDERLVEQLVQHAEQLGVRFRLGAAVQTIRKTGGGLRAELSSGDGVTADWVVHAAGRSPNTRELQLRAANVASDRHGAILVDNCCRSLGNDRVFAVGDCVAGGVADLASVANTQARQIARNLIDGDRRPVFVGSVPEVVFSTPRLARVGEPTDSVVDERRCSTHRGSWDTSGFVRKWASGELPTGYALGIDHEKCRLRFAELLHPHAAELVNLATMLIDAKMPLDHFVDRPLAYPSAGTQLQDAIRVAIGGQL